MKKLLFILSFSLLVLSYEFCNAQWVQTNGPCGGYISCFAVKGDTIFAGTGAGVFFSSNNGSSWVNIGLTIHSVTALALSGNNIFAGTDTSGLFCLQTMEAVGTRQV